MAYTLHRPPTSTSGQTTMLNLIRKFLRPTLREQLEAGVREGLRRYADRHTAPSLRVYVSTDLVPHGVDQEMWSRDEAEHLRRFSLQWAEDNSIARAGLRLEIHPPRARQPAAERCSRWCPALSRAPSSAWRERWSSAGAPTRG